jgi:hypothetical protein
MSMESHGGLILTGEIRRTRRKTCPITALSTTNPTCTDPGLCGGRPATNRLSRGTASVSFACIHPPSLRGNNAFGSLQKMSYITENNIIQRYYYWCFLHNQVNAFHIKTLNWKRTGFFSEFFGVSPVNIIPVALQTHIIWGMNNMSVSGSSSETSHPINKKSLVCTSQQ